MFLFCLSLKQIDNYTIQYNLDHERTYKGRRSFFSAGKSATQSGTNSSTKKKSNKKRKNKSRTPKKRYSNNNNASFSQTTHSTQQQTQSSTHENMMHEYTQKIKDFRMIAVKCSFEMANMMLRNSVTFYIYI